MSRLFRYNSLADHLLTILTAALVIMFVVVMSGH